jgi:E3 ubiquitin-protein ligase BRE1
MSVEEVLKAVEKEDNGVSFMETLAMIDGMNSKNVISSPGATSGVVSSSDGALSSPAFSAAVAGGSKDSSNGEEVAHLKKSLQDVQVIAETRDKKITELLAEREQQLKQINSLLLTKDDGGNSLEKEAIHNSPLFIEASTKLEISERRVKELESVNQKVMEKWARAKGDLELVKKAMSDMEEKHGRRWTELISQFSEADSTAGSPREESTGSSVSDTDPFCHAKKTAELESKLQQAMEAVSRMETLRSTLADAYKMNEQLQSKLEDLRSKNAKMVAEKVAAREKSKETESSVSASPHGPSRRSSAGGSSSTGDPAFDKLQRDYRRARKEVSAAVLSKDQAKLKQERAERERDALMKTNARLLKQSSDKDDMNAKSLSTILHLKQRNEELEKENAIVKQKAQAAQQLSLAARLSSNAKDRVGEEALKEKEVLDETVKHLEKECQTLRCEKDQAEGLLAQSKQKAASSAKDLDAARARCDDLVSESNKKEEEKKQMMESLAVVKKEAAESAMKAVSAKGNSDGPASAFTMEQMTTQVKYLSGRINCPVCNVREKKCILLRCRHMFCQTCVDVNIKNRSRKCPACGGRFDTKDVAEIWL